MQTAHERWGSLEKLASPHRMLDSLDVPFAA